MNQLIERGLIGIQTLALPEHRAIPFEAVGFELVQDAVCSTGLGARAVNIFHTHQPLATLLARIKTGGQRCDQRALMQGAGGGRCESTDIRMLDHAWIVPVEGFPLVPRLVVSGLPEQQIADDFHHQAVGLLGLLHVAIDCVALFDVVLLLPAWLA